MDLALGQEPLDGTNATARYRLIFAQGRFKVARQSPQLH